MAESVSEAGKALTVVALTATTGGDFSISISSESVEGAENFLRIVGVTAVTCFALYAVYQLRKAEIDAAVKIALGGNRSDQEIVDTKEGSLVVVLHCKTDGRFLEILEDYETGRMRECLEREFSKIEGIKVHGLKVEISNMDEVMKTKEDIKKRLTSKASTKIPKEHEEFEASKTSTSKRQGSEMAIAPKPLPADLHALRKEAYALGLMGPNASLENPRAKLVKYVNNSITIRRSINHVSILLVGSTGVGKSATINHLLGTNGGIVFAKTNASQSETRSTQEFIIYGNNREYAVKDIPLGLIDTPGFGDTDGTHQDACNIVSIKKFFRTHPSFSNCYPNLIFVIANANDKRMKGENSELGKTLRCIKTLNLVDPNHPNVVAVLTHACGGLITNVAKWSQKMEESKAKIEKIIFDALTVTAPVVLLENLYGEDDAGLKVCGDYTCLPNGEKQPKNLYDACAGVLKKSNDAIGLITLNSIFVSGAKCAPRRGHEIKANLVKSAKHVLVLEEKEFASLLEISARGDTTDIIEKIVSEYTKGKKLGPQERDNMFPIICMLRRLGVGDPPRFGSHSIESIEYVLGKKISVTRREMLQQAFQIPTQSPVAAVDSGRVIGQGFDIIKGDTVATRVMTFDGMQTHCGVVFPKCAQFAKLQQTTSIVNRHDGKSNSSSMSELSFLLEQRIFEVTMGNYKEYENNGMTFTRDFTSDVKGLPKQYKPDDDECRRRFENFFNRFGHCLVSSAYGGGSIKITCGKDVIGNVKEEDVKDCLQAWLEGADLSKTIDVTTLLDRCNFSYEGGDTFMIPPGNKMPDQEMLQKWKLSLPANPTFLKSKMRLEPISTAVACVDPGKKDATYDALKHLCGNKFQPSVDRERPREATSEKLDPNTRLGSLQKPKDDGWTCFPSSSVVNVASKDGVMTQKKMADLGVGEKVMAWDEKRNRAVFTEVIMFAHRETDAKDVKYLKITLEDGTKITLSANHLVMVGKQKKAIMAQTVKLGDILFTVDENQEISPKKVLSIDQVIEQGVYCPITSHGNVIVDNVLASCYASVQDHVLLQGLLNVSAQSLAHLGLMPMRVLHKLRLTRLREIPDGEAIHPYLQWLCKLKLPFMAN